MRAAGLGPQPQNALLPEGTHTMKKLTLALAGLTLAALWIVPAQAKDTSGPVTCKDGTTAAHGGRGACSKHGGIKKDAEPAKAATEAAPAAPAAPAVTAKTPAPAATAKPAAEAAPAAKAGSTHSVSGDATGATAKCKDGSYSHSKTHSGTCSKHGGVADWLDGSKK